MHWLSVVGLNEEKEAKLRIIVKEALSSKKEKGLTDMDNSVVMVGERGWAEVEEGLRGINGDGKIYDKNETMKEEKKDRAMRLRRRGPGSVSPCVCGFVALGFPSV